MKSNEVTNNSDYKIALKAFSKRVRRKARITGMPYFENAARYFEQEGILDRQGNNPLADYYVYRDVRNDAFYSETTWMEGIESLIPKTDYVSFHGTSGTRRIDRVPWDAVSRIVGYRMEPTDFSPTRFRVKLFPNQDEIAALQAYETDKGTAVLPIVDFYTLYAISLGLSNHRH